MTSRASRFCLYLLVSLSVLPACAEEEEDWEHRVLSPIQRIEARTAEGQIFLQGSPEQGEIVVTGSFRGGAVPAISEVSGTLTLGFECPEGTGDPEEPCDAEWLVTVPDDPLYTVDLESVTGNIQLWGSSVTGNVHSQYGNVVVSDVRSPQLGVSVDHFFGQSYSVIVQSSDIADLQVRAADYVFVSLGTPPEKVDIECGRTDMELPPGEYGFDLVAPEVALDEAAFTSGTTTGRSVRVRSRLGVSVEPRI